MRELDTDYEEINMADIDDEARELAKRWAENMNDDFIAQKVKLASDFMNYARRKCKEQRADCAKAYFDKQMNRAGGGKNCMESPVMIAIGETPLVI